MLLKIAGFALAGLVVALLVVRFAIGRMFSTGGAPPDAVQKTVTSKDGTRIAYEQTGAGPVVVLVSAALADRDGTRPLARQLVPAFTVINYDRRGRGGSADTQPYSVEREVEDLEALIDASGGQALVFGSSSGAVLALEAASRLDGKVRGLYLYEPPFIVDGSRPPVTEELVKEVNAALAKGDRNEAVTIFFSKWMGIPAPGVVVMRLLMPAWGEMAGMANTIPYDLAVVAGTQTGKPLPADRWAGETAPAMVAVGAKSEPFFHTGAKALTDRLHSVQYRSLEGVDHSAVLTASAALAAEIRRFFQAEK
jgi:pimeloyl-ACP methyl ester carboxylesterase